MNSETQKQRERYGALSGVVGIGVNLLLSALKLVVGILSASVSVTADALNNLSDAGSSVISMVSFKLSSKPADRDHPYGHARIEYIASMIVSFLILVVGVEMLLDSGKKLLGITEVDAVEISVWTLIVLGASILAKLGLALFYLFIAKKIDSQVVKAAAVDSLTDCISTSVVLVSGIVIKATGFVLLDAIAGLFVSVVILIAGVKILNETKNSLLGEAAPTEKVEAIKAIAYSYPETLGIHDMMVHNYGPNQFIASFHVEVDGAGNVFELHDVMDNIEKRVYDELGILATVHMDPIVTDNAQVTELRAFAAETVAEILPGVGIHDFRTVVGETHTNLIFDVVLPFESKFTPAEARERISEAILKKRPNHFCVITVDRG